MGALDFTIQQEQVINKLKADQDFIFLMTKQRLNYIRFTDMFESARTQDEYKTMPNLTILRVVDHALTDIDVGEKLHGKKDNPYGPTELDQVRNITVAEFAFVACIDKFIDKFSTTDLAGYRIARSPEPTYNDRKINFYMHKGSEEIRVLLQVINPYAEARVGANGLATRVLRMTVLASGNKKSVQAVALKDLKDSLENELKKL